MDGGAAIANLGSGTVICVLNLSLGQRHYRVPFKIVSTVAFMALPLVVGALLPLAVCAMAFGPSLFILLKVLFFVAVSAGLTVTKLGSLRNIRSQGI